MALEETVTGKELIDATQNAVIEAVGNVANIIKTTAHDIHGEKAFYEHATFWVAVSFVLFIVFLARPIAKIVNSMLQKRVEAIVKRITDAADLKDDAQKLLVEYERKFVNAELEANKILRKNKKEIELLKEESLAKLKSEMIIKEKEAEARLKAAQHEAMAEISILSTEMTIKAIKDAIVSKIDDKAQDELIDSSIKMIANLK